MPFLKGLRPKDLVQLRKWGQLEGGHRRVQATAALAEKLDLPFGPGAATAARDRSDQGGVRRGTSGDAIGAALQLRHSGHGVESFHLCQVVRSGVVS